MTPETLKRIEQLYNKWCNDPSSPDRDIETPAEVMDHLPDLIAAVKERDAAQKACEACRERINDAFASAWTNDDVEDGHYYVAASIMLDLKQLALSTDCGKGYHHESKCKPLVEVLLEIRNRINAHGWGSCGSYAISMARLFDSDTKNIDAALAQWEKGNQ